MGIVLPYEMWRLVASYIPKSALLKLYSVNRAFFDIVMNQLYREVNIYHIGDVGTRRYLVNMSPVAVKYVRALVLRLHFFAKPWSDTEKESESVARTIWRRIRRAKKVINLTAGQVFLRHITDMTEVTSLTIGCHPSDNFQLFSKTSIVDTALSAHNSRLQKLTLDIPLEAYRTILSSNPMLNSVEELNITLRTAYVNTDYNDILVLIARFVNQHAQLLISLTVATPEPIVNPFFFFSNLRLLSKLNKLSICHPLDQVRRNRPTGVDSFLTQQASFLKELKIRFTRSFVKSPPPSPDNFFAHPIFQVHFPRLSSLDLGLFRWEEVHKNSTERNLIRVKYLHSMPDSLSSLAVHDYVLEFSQVEAMVSVFSCRESQLRSLEMHMYFLSCNLLDLLYKQLPNLYRLELRFDCLINHDDGTWTPSYSWNGYNAQATSFVQDMADRRYHDWALRHLKVAPLYYCSGRWKECRTLLAASLPPVITLNDSSEQEFDDITDFTDFPL